MNQRPMDTPGITQMPEDGQSTGSSDRGCYSSSNYYTDKMTILNIFSLFSVLFAHLCYKRAEKFVASVAIA